MKYYLDIILKKLPIILFFTIFPIYSFGQLLLYPPIPKYPYKTNYQFSLEEPFGDLEFVIEYSSENVPSSIYFITTTGRIDLPNEDLEALEYIKDIDFGLFREREDQVATFSVAFESAPDYEVTLDFELPGCGSPCVTTRKSVSTIRLDTDFNITFNP